MCHFKIIRTISNFIIAKRILFKYIPVCYVTKFEDCFSLVSEYCTNNNISDVRIYDTDGPNKIMKIHYNEEEIYYFSRLKTPVIEVNYIEPVGINKFIIYLINLFS